MALHSSKWRPQLSSDLPAQLRPFHRSGLCLFRNPVVRVGRSGHGSLGSTVRCLFRSQTHLFGTRAPVIWIVDKLTKPAALLFSVASKLHYVIEIPAATVWAEGYYVGNAAHVSLFLPRCL